MSDKEKIEGCASGCAGCSGCGHDHEHAESFLPEGMSPIITLTDDEGKDTKFEVLDVVVLDDDKEFLVVSEVLEEEKEEMEVVILEIKQEGEEEVFDTVTDESLAERVFNEFVSQQEELNNSEE